VAKPRIYAFDIECTNLNANYGYILCVGWKEIGKGKVHCPTIADFPEFEKDCTNDKPLLRYVVKELSKADVIIGHYSVRFDMPYIQSRLIYHRMKIMPPIQHIDTWRIARYKMALNSNGLAAISKFLQTPDQKTPLTGPQWIRAAAGHVPSINYVKKHCVHDVKVEEQIYLRIRPLAAGHPNLGLLTQRPKACAICGETNRLVRRGWARTDTCEYRRWQCMNCGKWNRSIKAEKGGFRPDYR